MENINKSMYLIPSLTKYINFMYVICEKNFYALLLRLDEIVDTEEMLNK